MVVYWPWSATAGFFSSRKTVHILPNYRTALVFYGHTQKKRRTRVWGPLEELSNVLLFVDLAVVEMTETCSHAKDKM